MNELLRAYKLPSLDDVRITPYYSCDFLVATNIAAMDPFVGTAISSGTSNQPNISSANHPGIIRLLSSTNANSGFALVSNLAQLQIAGGEVVDVIFQLESLANNTTRLGFVDTAAVTDCTDGAYIEIDGSGVATGKTAQGGTRSSTGTTHTLSAGTWYRARVEVNADATLVTFTIYSDAGAVLWTNTLATNIPVTAGQLTGVGFVITNSQTSAITLAHVDFIGFGIKRPLVRGGM